jgi:LuxR family quorum sensing-dependent transcriptional regulator
VVPERSSEAFIFVEALDRLSSAEAVMDAMQRALGQFGFDSFFVSALPRPNQRFEDVVLAIRVPPEFLKVCRENQYIQVSPAIRHCRRTVLPFAWKSAPYDAEREPRAAELVDLVTEFGLSNAIMVPIPGPTGCEGGVWLGGHRLELTEFHMPMIHLMALYAFERIRTIANRVPSAKQNLTPREREALTWVALGKSAWEIGEILHIAKRTVDEHTQTAMHRLGAVNRAQAVALALRDRIIAP